MAMDFRDWRALTFVAMVKYCLDEWVRTAFTRADGTRYSETEASLELMLAYRIAPYIPLNIDFVMAAQTFLNRGNPNAYKVKWIDRAFDKYEREKVKYGRAETRARRKSKAAKAGGASGKPNQHEPS